LYLRGQSSGGIGVLEHRGRATSPLGSEARTVGQRSRSASINRELAKDASTTTTSNEGGGWSPHLAGAAVVVGALFTPFVAVGAVTAVGCGAVAAGVTMIANDISK
jgi:predicted phage tail protein